MWLSLLTNHDAEPSAELPCHRCGYDLRAHPQDGQCPECGESVAESRRLAAIPRRPAWRDSDPRWRRRVLAGAWVLVLLPLLDALKATGWVSSVPVPNVINSRGAVRTLDETLLNHPGLYHSLVFCVGVVLLFSKERGRRPGRLDRTRRWGVLCCYVVLLLSATQVFLIGALVAVGIGAIFLAMPLDYQPAVTPLFVHAGATYLLYGAHPLEGAGLTLVAFSSVAVLLACVPLFNALRGSGPKRAAAILLAPLAAFALLQVAQALRYGLGFSRLTSPEVLEYRVYFRPELLVEQVADLAAGLGPSASAFDVFSVEAAKWCIVLAVAVWTSVAQVAAWRKRAKPGAA